MRCQWYFWGQSLKTRARFSLKLSLVSMQGVDLTLILLVTGYQVEYRRGGCLVWKHQGLMFALWGQCGSVAAVYKPQACRQQVCGTVCSLISEGVEMRVWGHTSLWEGGWVALSRLRNNLCLKLLTFTYFGVLWWISATSKLSQTAKLLIYESWLKGIQS